ncbi:uncharacterized protein LOC113594389 isoform X2 [Acinonyx jubatus]|nr:uncharacterized protein LOC113594389 isoform X2 [Acinonyx jubatus]
MLAINHKPQVLVPRSSFDGGGIYSKDVSPVNTRPATELGPVSKKPLFQSSLMVVTEGHLPPEREPGGPVQPQHWLLFRRDQPATMSLSDLISKRLHNLSVPTVMATFWKPRGDTQRSYSYQAAETGFAPRGHPKPALTPPTQLSEKSHEGSDGTPVWLPSL